MPFSVQFWNYHNAKDKTSTIATNWWSFKTVWWDDIVCSSDFEPTSSIKKSEYKCDCEIFL